MAGNRRPGNRPSFSIVILARNEAEALPRLLSRFGRFLDRGGEVLVVDSGSTDDTVFEVRSYVCRVEKVGDRFDSKLDDATAAEIERRFAKNGEGPLVAAGQRLFHFGDARQHAGSLAANDLVLQLDASDELRAFNINALETHIAAQPVGGFEYTQLYGNVSLRIARFYDRRLFHWEGRVHEILARSHAELTPPPIIRCEATELVVRHHRDEQKNRTYLAGLALQVMEKPEQPRWLHYLGRELYYQRWYSSAIPLLEEHAAMEHAWATERSQSLCFAGQCHERLECNDLAKRAYRQAFSLDATRREPLLRLAALHCRLGEFEAAVQFARESLAIPHTSPYPEIESNYTWTPHSILYWSLFWLGRRDEARTHWEICIDLAPKESQAEEHARFFPPSTTGSTRA